MQTYTSVPFFYAAERAALYDGTARLTDRVYDTLHEVLLEVVFQHLKERKLGAELILDLGCGTGEEALRLLRRLPDCRVVAVDLSTEMLDIFRAKASAEFGEAAANRLKMINADFRDAEWMSQALPEGQAVGIVVSAYAFHHLQPPQKVKLYTEIASALRPGGIFVNGDLYSYASEWAASLAQQKVEDWIQRAFDDKELWNRSELLSDSELRAELLESWLTHVRNDNIPQPIHSACDTSRVRDRLWSERDGLESAGFSSVECIYRFFQSGVVIASK